MTLKPLNNRILVKPDSAEEKTESGIILAKETKEKPTTGTVVIGVTSVKLGDTPISKGDKVLFSKFGYDEVVINKETLYVISEQNILGIFEHE